MESLQYIKNRLKSVKNIGQITKAMEVVSATKMRKAQEVALHSRPYAFRALELLETIVANIKNQISNIKIEIPLTQSREVKNTLVVIVASDRGLAGAFNSQVIRATERLLAGETPPGLPLGEVQEGFHAFKFIIVGKKASSYALKRGMKVIETFTGFGDYALPEEVAPLAELVVNGFLKGKWDRVMTVSTHFRSTLKQETLVRQLLPLDVSKIAETVKEIIPEHGRYSEARPQEISPRSRLGFETTEYIFEPTPEEAVSALVPHLVNMQLYHLLLEANASEHSARMVAMKTASDNAVDLADGLTLQFNKARQASITKEIIEITSTMNALT